MRANRRVLLALSENTGVLDRFWANVDTKQSESGCWEWRGRLLLQEYPTFSIGNYSVAAAHVAWFTATGELPSGGRLRHVCENGRCVRPEHLAWALGRASRRRIDALGDGYVTSSGVPVTSGEGSLRRPGVMRYVWAPSRRSA